MVTHDDFLKSLPPERQAKIKEMAQKFIAEEKSLRQIRKAREFSQVTLAELLDMNQGDLSKFERRTDVYLSTIRRYIEAMGGKLELIATFPDGAPIKIANLGDLSDDNEAAAALKRAGVTPQEIISEADRLREERLSERYPGL